MSESDPVVVAIDGPAASGKSSVARGVAKKLGFIYVNSGNLYRAVTFVVTRMGAAGEEALLPQLREVLASAALHVEVAEDKAVVFWNRTELSKELSLEPVNAQVSAVAKIPEVRQWVLDKLRAFPSDHSVVMEGRDIGSVVFPQTSFKFYLDASPEVREQRRKAQGIDDRIRERDRMDSTRSSAPLTIAPDARVVDSSKLTLSETIDAVLEALREKGLAC